MEQAHFMSEECNTTLGEGCFVGIHLDTDSSGLPCGRSFTVWRSIFRRWICRIWWRTTSKKILWEKFDYSSNCDFEHEVTITSGKRKSLVFFLSGQTGEPRLVMKLGFFTMPFHPAWKTSFVRKFRNHPIRWKFRVFEAYIGEHATDEYEKITFHFASYPAIMDFKN